MSMYTYQCWHVHVPQEYIRARSSFAARQVFAKRHHKQVSECMARRRRDAPLRTFSDGTSIRSEP